MQFELLTLSGSRYQGEVAEVSLATAAGQLGILPHHEPLTAVVIPGAVSVREMNGHIEHFAAFGGLLEVTSEQVRLLADEAEPADKLVESEIEAAIAEAARLKNDAKNDAQLAHANRMMDRSTVRLGVARLKRPRRHH